MANTQNMWTFKKFKMLSSFDMTFTIIMWGFNQIQILTRFIPEYRFKLQYSKGAPAVKLSIMNIWRHVKELGNLYCNSKIQIDEIYIYKLSCSTLKELMLLS